MRVVLVTVGDPERRTGGYRYQARLLAGLAARGVEVRQVVAGPADSQAPAAAIPMVDVGAADVVVVDALARIACGPWIARWHAAGRPVVALVHELPSAADPAAADPDDEEALLAADRLVAVSDSVRATLLARGAPADRIRVVPPGYDRHGDPVVATEQRAEVRVLCVAQWIRRKGITELLRAWAAGDRTGARLALVGETDPDPDYADEVRSLVTDSVEVLGAIDDTALAAQYARADVFALPSTAEGYGIVYAEALSCGLPILACATGPIPDLVGDAALLVPPGDHAALAAALDRLLADAPLRGRLALHARRRTRDLPTWDDCSVAFLGVLREACGI